MDRRNISRPDPFAAAAVCFMLAVAVVACSMERPSTGVVGQPAPAYSAATLDGETVSLASLKGNVVLLNIWATWCAPCRGETPELQALYERFHDAGLEVVGVSVDGQAREAAIRAFVEELGVSYTILHDPASRVSSLFRVPAMPTSVLIGRNGTVLWRKVGAVQALEPELLKVLRTALGNPAARPNAGGSSRVNRFRSSRPPYHVAALTAEATSVLAATGRYVMI